MKKISSIIASLLVLAMTLPAYSAPASEPSDITLSLTLIYRCSTNSSRKPPYLSGFWAKVQSIEDGSEWDIRLTSEPSIYQYVWVGTLNDQDNLAPFIVQFYQNENPIGDWSGPHGVQGHAGQTYGVWCPYEIYFPIFRGGSLAVSEEE